MRCILLLVIVCFAACHSADKGAISIQVDHGQKSVIVSGLSDASAYGLKTDSISTQAWHTLLIVCKMPADTELRDDTPIQPGKYQIINNKISYTPDTPFVKGTKYFARYFQFDDGLTSVNMITDKRKPGRAPYTELIFKY